MLLKLPGYSFLRRNSIRMFSNLKHPLPFNVPFDGGSPTNLMCNFINGNSVKPIDSYGVINVESPSTGKTLWQMELSGNKTVDEAVVAAKTALSDWKRIGYSYRGNLLLKVAEYLRENLSYFAMAEVCIHYIIYIYYIYILNMSFF